MLIIVEVYSHCCLPSIKESLFFPGHEILQNWGEYLKIGLPAMIMFCAEYWAFGGLIFLSGRLGVHAQAVMTIAFQIIIPPSYVNISCNETAVVLIGNQIGANNVPLAKRYAKLIFCLALAIGCFNLTLLITWHNAIASIFTSHPDLIDSIVFMIPGLML